MVFITRVTICGSPTSMPSLDVSLVAEPNFISIWLRQQLVHMISWLIMAISFTSFHYSWHNMRGSYGLPFEILMCSLHVRQLHDHYMVVLSYFSTDGGKVWMCCCVLLWPNQVHQLHGNMSSCFHVVFTNHGEVGWPLIVCDIT